MPAAKAAGSLGSSPLTRGKPPKIPALALEDRLIPAHAGKTQVSRGPSALAEAHPRSRGENWPRSRAAVMSFGSSPLTRGKPGVVWASVLAVRLIPAHAGKTDDFWRANILGMAHPRSRGENC